MKLEKLILTKNNCYKVGKTQKITGIMIHSTGANNPHLRRYVGPDDGKLGVNKYNNHWNTAKPDGVNVCVHGFIGKDKDGDIRTYQTLPWNMVGWHSGSGRLGSARNANKNGYIGIEICEDNLLDAAYFNAVYKEAVELCVYLCKRYKINPRNIICHSEGYKMGIASNHADVMHWFPKHGKSMDSFRDDVEAALKVPAPKEPIAAANTAIAKKKYYRVQLGAFGNKNNAQLLVKQLRAKGIDNAIIKYI